MTKNYIENATAAIRETLIATMPVTAAANGLTGPIPTRADAAAVLDGPQGAAIERMVGLSGLQRSLSSLGLRSDKQFARAVREEIIRRDMMSAN